MLGKLFKLLFILVIIGFIGLVGFADIAHSIAAHLGCTAHGKGRSFL